MPARNAICALTKDDDELLKNLLAQVELDLHERANTIPAHLLQLNLYQESHLIVDLYTINQKELKEDNTKTNLATSAFWRVLFTSL